MTLHLEKMNDSKHTVSCELGSLQQVFDHLSRDNDLISIGFLGVELTFDFASKEFFIDKN